MLICAYILSICGLIFCTIPALGLVISIIGFILFNIIQKTRKYNTSKVILIFGFVISITAVILCIIYNLTFTLRAFTEDSGIVSKTKASTIGIQRGEIEERIDLYCMVNKVVDKQKYVKEKLILSKVKNENIVYSSSTLSEIEDKSLKDKIALKNSKTDYYKINSKNIDNLSSSINIDNFVIDLRGNVYINVKLD